MINLSTCELPSSQTCEFIRSVRNNTSYRLNHSYLYEITTIKLVQTNFYFPLCSTVLYFLLLFFLQIQGLDILLSLVNAKFDGRRRAEWIERMLLRRKSRYVKKIPNRSDGKPRLVITAKWKLRPNEPRVNKLLYPPGPGDEFALSNVPEIHDQGNKLTSLKSSRHEPLYLSFEWSWKHRTNTDLRCHDDFYADAI